MAEYLLENGANPKAKAGKILGRFGKTPYGYAKKAGSKKLAKTLKLARDGDKFDSLGSAANIQLALQGQSSTPTTTARAQNRTKETGHKIDGTLA